MGEVRDTVQEQLIAARRAQIIDAATRVFADKGFHRATIRDIARQAGIAEGTIYNYFGNKADLLIGILSRLDEHEEREEHFVEGREIDFRSFLAMYLRRRMQVLWPNIDVFRATLPEMLVNPELREMYFRQIIEPTTRIGEQFFRAMIDEGKAKQLDVPLTIRAISGTVLGLLVLQLLGDEQIAARWEELPEVLATLICDGLSNA